MKTVFLTGISGLLGTNLAIDLLDRGYFVKGLVRNKSRYHGGVHKNLKLIESSIFDDLSPFCRNCDYIVHAAAETRQNLSRYSDYRKINFEATVNLFNIAVKCHIEKFVFVSTANTLGYGTHDKPGTEQIGMKFPFSASFYARSKREAEDFLLKNNHQTKVIIVHPTFMLGAFDSKPSSGKIIRMLWGKKFVFYPPGGKNFVHVRDVSEGIIRILEKGSNGEKYLLANENLSYLHFFQKLNHILDQHTVLLRIPGATLTALGYLGDFLRSLHIRTNLSSVNMKSLCVSNFYSNTKSVRELEMEYRALDKAIEDAVRYFNQHSNH